MIWIDTHVVQLQLKSKLTKFTMLQLVLMEIRPTPYTSINHMWKALATCNLQAIKGVQTRLVSMIFFKQANILESTTELKYTIQLAI